MMSHAIGAYEASSVDAERILGTEVSPTDPDRSIIEPWAESVQGHILDVGSGTGRWTGHLAGLGHSVAGLEPAESLVQQARIRHPSVVFHHSSIADLVDGATQWDGILAWYSTIHFDFEELPHALSILREALEDRGSLLLSFFSGPRREVLNHPITTAYRWPMAEMLRVLKLAGFDVTEHHSNPNSSHAYVSAVARPAPQ